MAAARRGRGAGAIYPQSWQPDPHFDQRRWNTTLFKCLGKVKPIDFVRYNRSNIGNLFRSRGFKTSHDLSLCWGRKQNWRLGESDMLEDPVQHPEAFASLKGSTVVMMGDSMMHNLYEVSQCVRRANHLSATLEWVSCPLGDVKDWATFIRKYDHATLLVVNFGAHFNVDGVFSGVAVPGSDAAAYRRNLRAFQKWATLHVRSGLQPSLLWIENKAQHFDGGTYYRDSLGVKDGCEREVGGCQCTKLKDEWINASDWRNRIASPIVRKAGVPIMPSFASSLGMWEDHNGIDCTHFCHNGPQMRHDVQQLWTHVLRDGQGLRAPTARIVSVEAVTAAMALSMGLALFSFWYLRKAKKREMEPGRNVGS